ncbi:MAG: hypothetical protein BGO21_22000 [Dyadobacter sp. 50-39]|uniref:T9SS C-terminal target domain-containing protein n=1 Tax=Dyadobacter sp. 50-39 TaxID=1895756 RepID=UPI00095B34D5|nr:T9SS C-terminal target domain-containing protein [Dyadobacter sp. 50-39]OJV19738.1 MAG: hypothetical protein BGO21_22000 [Dyadobacter sp. 50-39]
MKKLTTWLLALLVISFSTAILSCKTDDDGDDPVIVDPVGETITVKGSITTATTWKAANKYILEGFVYVDNNATLTIEPGTIIKGDKLTKGSLIVKPGSKIMAEGTAAKPIVFTSSAAKGARNYGDWGGIILLGKAPVNKTPATIEGENVSTFGGTDAADNSGTLKYVRIEFAGISFETDKEINGLTLGGVGSGTTIDYIQVSYSGDDAYEWFGGTVSPKHLISYRTLDDDFDTDWGFSGNVQYGIALRDPAVADQCSCSDSNGFESDNDAAGSGAAPKTSAKFSNMSIFIAPGTPNAKFRSAFRIRRNSAVSIYNSVVSGAYPKGGLELEGDSTQNNFKLGRSNYSGLVLSGMTKAIVSGDTTMLKDATRKNMFGADIATLKLDAAYNTLGTGLKFLPQTGSPLLTGGVTLPTGFEANTYIGAFGTTDWTAGWTNFDPQNTEY